MAGYAVADPDLHISNHPDFEIRGGGLQKQIFRPFLRASAADISLVLFAFL